MQILDNELLAKHTTFKVGGPAKYFSLVKNIDDFAHSLNDFYSNYYSNEERLSTLNYLNELRTATHATKILDTDIYGSIEFYNTQYKGGTAIFMRFIDLFDFAGRVKAIPEGKIVKKENKYIVDGFADALMDSIKNPDFRIAINPDKGKTETNDIPLGKRVTPQEGKHGVSIFAMKANNVVEKQRQQYENLNFSKPTSLLFQSQFVEEIRHKNRSLT